MSSSSRSSILLGALIVCSLLFHGIVTAPVPDPVPVQPIQTVPHVPQPPAPIVPEKNVGVATAYCNCKDRMNGETGVTAAGYSLDNGLTYKGYRILAADKKYPFGTIVEMTLESGETITGIVLDRGGAVKGNHFDIVYKSRSKAYDFGVQDIKFEIKGRMKV